MQVARVVLVSLMLTGCATDYGAMTCAVGEINDPAKSNCGCGCAVTR
jgi:hypothetical protein